MELYVFLLVIVGILAFFGGFGCGVDYEYLRNKKVLEEKEND